MSGRGGRLADRVAAGAAAILVFLLLLRVVRYLPVSLPQAPDEWLGNALIFAWLLFIFPLLLAPWHLAGVALLLLTLLLFPRAFVDRGDGWRLRPWFHALVWVECAINHYVFDLNPHLALLTALGFLAVEIDGRLRRERQHDRRYALAVVGLLSLWVLAADTLADVVAGFLFAAIVWVALRGVRLAGLRERRLLVLLSGAACQLLAAFLPLLAPLHGGTPLGRGLAYSFCESPDARRLFAAVPEAPTMLPWSLGGHHGADGYVAEYDLPDLRTEQQHRFFSDDFYGRLEWVQCLDDVVQVGMTNTTFRGQTRQDHAMQFWIDDPARFDPDVTHGEVGHGIVYDARRDQLYYVSENRPTIKRLDRRSGRLERVMARVPQPKPVLSLVVGPSSYDAARDSFFVTEWFWGTHAYEVDLETQQRVHLYPHRNGGALGLAVDEEYGRLYVVGVWGMEVFDIATGKVVARRRLGLLGRSPAIDRRHGLVYVASTSDGRIRVFDRGSLRLLGVIAVGYGPRIPFFSSSADRLFASTMRGSWSWDGAELAERFRGAR